MRLVQLVDPTGNRRLAFVDEPSLHLLREYRSVYQLAQDAIATGQSMADLIFSHMDDRRLPYDEVYEGRSEWRILPAADQPEEPARCLVSGTGLTHMASAKNRDAMHAREEDLTDSMRMYRWGLERGKPEPGKAGVAPEWFYKGTGLILRAHNEPLVVPAFSEDGGEEPEIAAVYVIDSQGAPWRIGFCIGDEFSDHEFERRNYLNLAGSKLRTCALGPELVLDAVFDQIKGRVTVNRAGSELWSAAIQSGASAMCHSLQNIEHHHFKFESHRRPGDVHIHFLGADAFSFGAGVRLQDGDLMQVSFDGFGRPLCNPLRVEARRELLVEVRSLNVAPAKAHGD